MLRVPLYRVTVHNPRRTRHYYFGNLDVAHAYIATFVPAYVRVDIDCTH